MNGNPGVKGWYADNAAAAEFWQADPASWVADPQMWPDPLFWDAGSWQVDVEETAESGQVDVEENAEDTEGGNTMKITVHVFKKRNSKQACIYSDLLQFSAHVFPAAF